MEDSRVSDSEGSPSEIATLRERLALAVTRQPDDPRIRFVGRLVEEAERVDEVAVRTRLLARAEFRLGAFESEMPMPMDTAPGHGPRTRDELARRVRTRTLLRARRRGVRIPADADEGLGGSEVLYRRRAHDVRSHAMLDEAVRAIPEEAGRYHAASVAADTLVALRGFRGGYLSALLARVEALGVLTLFTDTVVERHTPAK